jgi:2-oxoglutarate ferredoxin oxidoreductase subunit alpha
MGEDRRRNQPDDLNVVICGEAGQGIKTVESLLVALMRRSGRYVYSTKEYMSRIRGGSNSTDLRISGRPVECPVERVDLLVALAPGALDHVAGRAGPDTAAVADPETLEAEIGEFPGRMVPVPIGEMAGEAGREVYSNTVAAGVVAGAIGLDAEECLEVVEERFRSMDESDRSGNLTAFRSGYEAGRDLGPELSIPSPAGDTGEALMLSGGQATGLGAIAGGLRFICSYPMSPSTAVLAFLAGQARDFGLVVEQAEDEISAVNMGLGAWFAGARSMITTSGGGLALMSEGISLAGMVETPLVLHVAQRPGPATGLPTRTGQEDLELVLGAGHGEFPVAVLAPGSLRQAFDLAARAFWLAEKHQVPVFLLTDQSMMDSYYAVSGLDIGGVNDERFVVDAAEDYRRYSLEDGPPSPMAVPGSGPGLVCLDSDEHDEAGHITEDLDLRVRMVEKRLGKAEGLAEDALEPELAGEGRTVVVCWGSARNACLEAVSRLDREDACVMHLAQPYPLHPKVGEVLEGADAVVSVEGNATGQMGRLLGDLTGIGPDHEILRYDGLPFRADTLADRLSEVLEGGRK